MKKWNKVCYILCALAALYFLGQVCRSLGFREGKSKEHSRLTKIMEEPRMIIDD